jgi:MFS family permease
MAGSPASGPGGDASLPAANALEAPPTTGARSTGSLLRRTPNFRRLWIGSVASAGGTAIGSIIVTWLIYSATRSALAVSLLGIVQFVPTLAFGLFAGALIDRLDRRRLMVTCDIARAICFGGLAVAVLLVGVSVVGLLAVIFVVSTFSTIFRPATNATIPRILGPAEIAEGNGLLQGGTTIAQFIGSPIGGVVLIGVGAVAGLALNALTFGLSAALIALMVIPRGGGPPAAAAGAAGTSLVREVAEGLRYLRVQTTLLRITLAAMSANFFLSIWGAFAVVYVAQQLGQGATGFGLFTAATTAGFAVGAILPGRVHSERAPGRWLPLTWGPTGLLLIALAFTTSLAPALLLEFGTGCLLGFGNTTWLTGVQRTVPDAMLGRYFATDEAASFAMIPAGVAVGGGLVVLLGISGAYLFAGIGDLAAGAVLVVSPSVWAWGKVAGQP